MYYHFEVSRGAEALAHQQSAREKLTIKRSNDGLKQILE